MNRLLYTATILAAITGTSVPSFAQDKSDGVLTVATVGEPPSLDIMQTTIDLVLVIGNHIFETLYTYDAQWKSAPLLAAALPEISEDGLTYRIPLREGVKFHDGSDLDSKDVVASLQRWMSIHAKGKQVATIVDSIAEDGAHAVVITLK